MNGFKHVGLLMVVVMTLFNCSDDEERMFLGRSCEDVLFIVEEMPSWPDCEERQFSSFCTNAKVKERFQNYLIYPADAWRNEIQGKVLLNCIIDTFGQVRNCRVIKSLTTSCDEEALRLTKLLPLFDVGRQRGRPVCVQWNFEVNFEL